MSDWTGKARPSRLGPGWVEIGRAAKELGHQAWVHPTESGKRFAYGCSCGFNLAKNPGHKPRTAATQEVAAESVVKHVRRVVLVHAHQGAVDGVSRASLPKSVGGRV